MMTSPRARTVAIAIALLVPTAAAAGRVVVTDLDTDDDAPRVLAESAGACEASLPAFIRTWCNSKPPRKTRFSKRYDVTARAAGTGLLTITVPVTEFGKGFVWALVQPNVTCSGNSCLPAKTVSVRIRTPARAADVRAVTTAFYATGMWRDRQWWGPKLGEVAVELFDETGKKIAEGTVAP